MVEIFAVMKSKEEIDYVELSNKLQALLVGLSEREIEAVLGLLKRSISRNLILQKIA